MSTNETTILTNPEQTILDVTDKSLYSFNDRESMTKFREVATIMALNRFMSLADSSTARFIKNISEKAPHIKKVFDSLKGETELVAKLSEDAKRKLESSEWRWIFAKDGSGMLPTLFDNKDGHFAKGGQIMIDIRTIKPELLSSLIGLTQKNNLNELMERIVYLTDIVERISAGQYNDRISMYYSSRQMYIEAMSMTDMENRRVALLNAAKSANDAISTLQQTIRSDLNSLYSVKPELLTERTKLIAKCFSKLNDSVQISVNVYAALGENRALLSAVTSYQCFVEQTLLSVPNKPPKKYTDCTLADIMYSSSELRGVDWRKVPTEIVAACETIIRTELDMQKTLSDEIEYEELRGQANEEM